MGIVLKYLIIVVRTVRNNHFIDTGFFSGEPLKLRALLPEPP